MRISDWSSDVCSSDLDFRPESGSNEGIRAPGLNSGAWPVWLDRANFADRPATIGGIPDPRSERLIHDPCHARHPAAPSARGDAAAARLRRLAQRPRIPAGFSLAGAVYRDRTHVV